MASKSFICSVRAFLSDTLPGKNGCGATMSEFG